MFPTDAIQKILYDYKYNSLSLEKTLTKIFVVFGGQTHYIENKQYLSEIEDLAWELVQYKFHRVLKHDMTKYIEYWVEEKRTKLCWFK